MSIFKDSQLQKQDGSLVDAVTALADAKVVLLYFSAHWCPPCRGFTPSLKDFYEDCDSSDLAIIFVTSDRSEADMKSYFSTDHGDYFAVPFGSELIAKLKTLCNVSGIPMLCQVDKAGSQVINAQVRGMVSSSTPPKTTLKTLLEKA